MRRVLEEAMIILSALKYFTPLVSLDYVGEGEEGIIGDVAVRRSVEGALSVVPDSSLWGRFEVQEAVVGTYKILLKVASAFSSSSKLKSKVAGVIRIMVERIVELDTLFELYSFVLRVYKPYISLVVLRDKKGELPPAVGVVYTPIPFSFPSKVLREKAVDALRDAVGGESGE